jgi:hypothetical protein
MSKLTWLAEAAEAFEQAAKQPRFPGDPSPLAPLLDKLVAKLYSECWEGGQAPKCGKCPVCRAFLTEKATEDEAAAWRWANERDLAASENSARASIAETTASDLADAVERLVDVKETLLSDLQSTAEGYLEAERAFAEASLERGEAQKHVADLTERLKTSEFDAKLWADRFYDLRAALKELV